MWLKYPSADVTIGGRGEEETGQVQAMLGQEMAFYGLWLFRLCDVWHMWCVMDTVICHNAGCICHSYYIIIILVTSRSVSKMLHNTWHSDCIKEWTYFTQYLLKVNSLTKLNYIGNVIVKGRANTIANNI